MHLYIETLALILLFEAMLFVVAHFIKRSDLADFGWGIGFALAGLYTYLKNPSANVQQAALLFLVFAWMFRLSGYMGIRMSGKKEDQRYVAMREAWKNHPALRTFLVVFQFQGLLLWLYAIPMIYHLSATDLNPNLLTWVVLGVSLFGMSYEAIADSQKAKFKQNNKSTTAFIRSGVFKYSRYPQYFGEVTFWAGIALFQPTWGPHLLLLYAPLMLFLMLRYVSGVKLLEDAYMKRPGYKEYAAKTPMMIPNFRL